AEGGGVEGLQPDAGHAQPGEVGQAAAEPLEVPDAVVVGVHVLLHAEAVDDGVLVPQVFNRHDPSRVADFDRFPPTAPDPGRRRLPGPDWRGNAAAGGSAARAPFCSSRRIPFAILARSRAAGKSERGADCPTAW